MFCVGPVEPAFNIKRFRPVRKSNIDIFKKILEPESSALVGAYALIPSPDARQPRRA